MVKLVPQSVKALLFAFYMFHTINFQTPDINGFVQNGDLAIF